MNITFLWTQIINHQTLRIKANKEEGNELVTLENMILVIMWFQQAKDKWIWMRNEIYVKDMAQEKAHGQLERKRGRVCDIWFKVIKWKDNL